MKLSFLCLSLFLFSCASYQNGKVANEYGKTLKKDLYVTAYQDFEYSTPHFSYIQVEFGNKTNDWFDVSKVLVNYKGDDLQIVLGPRLVDWANGIENKVAVDRHNNDLLLGTLAVGAMVAASSSANQGNFAATQSYIAVMAGTAVAGSVNELSNEVSDIERAKVFPQGHLYTPFSAAPGLVNKRWILIQHAPGVQITSFSFDVYLKNKEKRTYNVKI